MRGEVFGAAVGEGFAVGFSVGTDAAVTAVESTIDAVSQGANEVLQALDDFFDPRNDDF